ncbi:MAG: hypothetical protein WDN48_20180 [Pseudolabrys sp.]
MALKEKCGKIRKGRVRLAPHRPVMPRFRRKDGAKVEIEAVAVIPEK